MKTYSLSTEGVMDWQNDLYASSEVDQIAERTFIETNFEEWLVERFGTTPNQLAFLESLTQEFVCLMRDELVLSLRGHLEIRFERNSKEEKNLRDSDDSLKYLEYLKWLEREKEGEQPEDPEVPDEPNKPNTHKSKTLNSANTPKGYFLVRTYYP